MSIFLYIFIGPVFLIKSTFIVVIIFFDFVLEVVFLFCFVGLFEDIFRDPKFVFRF
jgi:hypothetical protein